MEREEKKIDRREIIRRKQSKQEKQQKTPKKKSYVNIPGLSEY